MNCAKGKTENWWARVMAAGDKAGLSVLSDVEMRQLRPKFPLLQELRDEMLRLDVADHKVVDKFRQKYWDPFGRCRRRKSAQVNTFANACPHGGQVSSGGCGMVEARTERVGDRKTGTCIRHPILAGRTCGGLNCGGTT
jgi:hypothetical protein